MQSEKSSGLTCKFMPRSDFSCSIRRKSSKPDVRGDILYTNSAHAGACYRKLVDRICCMEMSPSDRCPDKDSISSEPSPSLIHRNVCVIDKHPVSDTHDIAHAAPISHRTRYVWRLLIPFRRSRSSGNSPAASLRLRQLKAAQPHVASRTGRALRLPPAPRLPWRTVTMTNFGFLQAEWPQLFADAQKAEALVIPDPRTACF